jgi:hypothetical protein
MLAAQGLQATDQKSDFAQGGLRQRVVEPLTMLLQGTSARAKPTKPQGRLRQALLAKWWAPRSGRLQH